MTLSESQPSQPSVQEPIQTDQWREFKRVEGLYLQMRMQFEEKSLLLEAARKELFHEQERLEILRRDQEERHVYERTLFDKSMEDFLDQLEQEYAGTVANLQKEVRLLEEIISIQMSPAG